jgi:hypothetical protein
MTGLAAVNQSSGSYYKCFHEYYMEHMLCVFVLHTQIDDVVIMYEENDPFSFLHYWKILGNE